MSRDEIDALCRDHDIELLLLDGFDAAFMGLILRFGINEPVALYNRAKCIEILTADGAMSEEGAEEYFSFNVIGAWVGDQTPAFFESLSSVDHERDPRVLR
jgi:hypothetical protein